MCGNFDIIMTHFLLSALKIGRYRADVGTANSRLQASPLLVIEGSGGLADLLSYAYRQQHSLNPSSVNLNSSVLESDIRQMCGTFLLNFHRFDRFELDLRGHTQP